MNVYKKALSLMIKTAEEEENESAEPAPSVSLDELRGVISELGELDDSDDPSDFTDEEVAEFTADIMASPNPTTRLKAKTDMFLQDLWRRLYGKGKDKRIGQEIKRLLEKEFNLRKLEPPIEDTIETSRDSAGRILERSDKTSLDPLIPTDPAINIKTLDEQYKRRQPRATSAQKALQEAEQKALEESADAINDFLDSAAQNVLNQWLVENGFSPEEIPENANETESFYIRDQTTSDEIQTYIRLYAQSVNPAAEYNEAMLSPLIFYGVLNAVDKEKGFKFSEFIYRLAYSEDIQLSARAKVAEQFLKWLIPEIKNILLFISDPVNQYMLNNPEKAEDIEPLDENKINKLLSHSGGYINDLIMESFEKKMLPNFIREVEKNLETQKQQSQEQRHLDKLHYDFNSAFTPLHKFKNIILSITKDQRIFAANTKEALTIKQTYNEATNRYPTITREVGQLSDEQILEKTKVGVPFDLSLTHEDLNYKVYPEPNGNLTIVTKYTDKYSRSQINQAIADLKAKRSIEPKTFSEWEQIVIDIGKARLGREKAQEEIERIKTQGEVPTRVTEDRIRSNFEQEFEAKKIDFEDKALDPKETSKFFNDVIDKAEEYLSQDDVFYLACSFIINSKTGDVVKNPDIMKALKYGVKEPSILTPYFKPAKTAFSQFDIIYKKAIQQLNSLMF